MKSNISQGEWATARVNGHDLDLCEPQPPRDAFSIDLPSPWSVPSAKPSRADRIVSVVRAALWLTMAALIAWLMKGGW